MKNKGFTLIELLVVIAIIGILAVIIVASLGSARMKSQDAAVISATSQYRNKAALDFGGSYIGLCNSSSYTDLENYVISQGRTMADCDEGPTSYRVITTHTTSSNSEDAFCINSNGFAGNVVASDANLLIEPDCSIDEPGASLGIPVNAVCGADSGQVLPNPPTNLCSAGTFVDFSSIINGIGGISYSWTCYGIYGGTNDTTCSALHDPNSGGLGKG